MVYKHFESKEAIWNAWLDQMITCYADHFGSAEHLPPVPDSLEGLVTMTMQMVNFTVHDEKVTLNDFMRTNGLEQTGNEVIPCFETDGENMDAYLACKKGAVYEFTDIKSGYIRCIDTERNFKACI